jgi:hypothetical protein
MAPTLLGGDVAPMGGPEPRPQDATAPSEPQVAGAGRSCRSG